MPMFSVFVLCVISIALGLIFGFYLGEWYIVNRIITKNTQKIYNQELLNNKIKKIKKELKKMEKN